MFFPNLVESIYLFFIFIMVVLSKILIFFYCYKDTSYFLKRFANVYVSNCNHIQIPNLGVIISPRSFRRTGAIFQSSLSSVFYVLHSFHQNFRQFFTTESKVSSERNIYLSAFLWLHVCVIQGVILMLDQDSAISPN